MTNARDVFTLPLFEREPTIGDLLHALPADVCNALIGSSPKSESEAETAAAGLPAAKREIAAETAEVILNGARLEPEQLEELARAHGLTTKKGQTRHATVLALIQKLGLPSVREMLREALKPGTLDNHGSFAHFAAPRLDLSAFDAVRFTSQLEQSLEKQLSPPGETRLVKVRAEVIKGKLLVSVHYERPGTEGRKIGTDKRLSTEAFARGAGLTYFLVKKAGARTRVMFRSPTSSLTKKIRPALSRALWKHDDAISDTPADAYDLSVFKDPSFGLDIVSDYEDEVESIRLAEIDVDVATGNTIRVRANGRNGDALGDFHEVSRRARILIQQSTVQSVLVKFRSSDDRRRLRAKVRIQPHQLTLDEQHWRLVEDHLREWGVVGE